MNKKKIKKRRQVKVPTYSFAGTAGSLNNLLGVGSQLKSVIDAQKAQNLQAKTMIAAETGDPTGAQAYNSAMKQQFNQNMADISAANNPLGASSEVAAKAKGSGISSGISKAGNIASDVGAAIGGVMDLADTFTGESTATTQGEVVGQSLMAVGKGVSTGVSVGAQIGGPWGAVIGGVAGGLMGAIGKKGRYASMTSFTDYDEGTLSTGFRALGGANKRRRRERARVKANAYDNRDALRGTAELEKEYAEEYGQQDTNTFAIGGQSNSLAYVDDGELLRTPDGTIAKVPERGKPTDSNLVNIPDGTRILSDKLKVPGTNKTFAQMGEKMIKHRRSKGKDIYAENANKLNQMNEEQVYNQLFNLQEMVKAQRGIKPKSKQLIPAAKDGLQTYGYNHNLSDFKYWDSKNNKYTDDYLKWVNGLTQQDVQDIYSGKYGDMSTYLGRNKGYIPTVDEAKRLMTDKKYGDWHKIGQAYVNAKSAPIGTIANPSHPELLGRIGEAEAKGTGLSSITQPQRDQMPMPPTGSIEPTFHYMPKTRGIGSNFDWAGLIGSAAALPGIISDLSTRPEKFDAVYNPYSSTIRDVMAGRRYDIDAAMAEGRRNRAVSNYNANQMNTNTGANLAYRLQSARNYDNYVAKLRDTKNNVENQYKAEYANALNDLGRQWVNATNLAVDQNARSRAAARNIQRQGMAEIAQLGQTWAKSYNERQRDKEMLPLYWEFLKSGMPTNALNALAKNLPRKYLKQIKG